MNIQFNLFIFSAVGRIFLWSSSLFHDTADGPVCSGDWGWHCTAPGSREVMGYSAVTCEQRERKRPLWQREAEAGCILHLSPHWEVNIQGWFIKALKNTIFREGKKDHVFTFFLFVLYVAYFMVNKVFFLLSILFLALLFVNYFPFYVCLPLEGD